MAIRERLLELVERVTGTSADTVEDGTLLADLLDDEREGELLDAIVEEWGLSEFDVTWWDAFGGDFFGDDPDVKTFGDLVSDAIEGIGVDHVRGDLPDSIDFDATVFRWHEKQYLEVEAAEDLYVPFQDGPWKWTAQGRFAGEEMNCGHYFGLNEEAATAEVCHYAGTRSVPGTHALIEFRVRARNVLDLTQPDIMQRVVRACVDDPDSHVVHNPFWMAGVLIAKDDYMGVPTSGGNTVTDYIGHWAWRQGYSGVLFLGARAIGEASRWSLENDSLGQDRMLGGGWPTLQKLRRNLENVNVVFFSGPDLLSRTSHFRIQTRPKWLFRKSKWTPNPHHTAPPDTIYGLSPFDADYQETKSGGWFASKPTFVPLTEEETRQLRARQQESED